MTPRTRHRTPLVLAVLLCALVAAVQLTGWGTALAGRVISPPGGSATLASPGLEHSPPEPRDLTDSTGDADVSHAADAPADSAALEERRAAWFTLNYEGRNFELEPWAYWEPTHP